MEDKSQKIEAFKAATAAALRALAGKKQVSVNYSSTESPYRITQDDSEYVQVPAPDAQFSAPQSALVRAASDKRALRIKHHDKKLHAKNAPSSSTARQLFDVLEQARVEAIGMRDYEGIAQNIGAIIGEIERRHGTPAEGAAWTAEQLYTAATRHFANLQEEANDPLFAAMARKLDNQQDFARTAKLFVTRLLGETQKGESDNTPNDEDAQQEQEQKPPEDKPENDDAEKQDTQKMSEDHVAKLMDLIPETDTGEEEGESFGEGDGDGDIVPDFDRPEGYITGPLEKYSVYTTEYDEVVKAETLADGFELSRLRQLLDEQVAPYQALVARLANKLQRKLQAQQKTSWLFDLEEGTLDTARLARVVANPDIPLAFKQEKQSKFRDTVITLLLDNSGSMRGRPILMTALCADILARTLERCQIKLEILGYTTRAWKGGRARENWIENSRPEKPGRLNELRHIVYKSADANYRRARKNLGLMLKEGLLKENIDGEALSWAYNRLAKRGEHRKILIVISDGAPVDDSTLSVNPANVLEQDLRNVIGWIEHLGKVELAAIGIGHDVTRYYQNAIRIGDINDLAPVLIHQLEELFG
ncbi:MAG: cobaltochelatase subunit CobT [Alphaproteobacteria bacterium]|nr:cobaltochelatase subunit CobT [Alphaproteobacteria bacterium]